MGGDLSAPGRRLGAPSLARGRCRGRAADAGPLSPHPQAGGDPPLRALWHRGCSPRAGAAGPSNGASHCLAGQDHRQGRSLRSRRCAMAQAPPLSSDLPRKDHRHLSGWTEPSVHSVRTLVSIETTFHGKFSAPIGRTEQSEVGRFVCVSTNGLPTDPRRIATLAGCPEFGVE